MTQKLGSVGLQIDTKENAMCFAFIHAMTHFDLPVPNYCQSASVAQANQPVSNKYKLHRVKLSGPRWLLGERVFFLWWGQLFFRSPDVLDTLQMMSGRKGQRVLYRATFFNTVHVIEMQDPCPPQRTKMHYQATGIQTAKSFCLTATMLRMGLVILHRLLCSPEAEAYGI